MHWQQLKTGQELPKKNFKPINRVEIAKFASAAKDFSPLHLDDSYAKTAGFGERFVPSLFVFAFAEDSVRKILGNSYIISITSSFEKLLWPEQTLTCLSTIEKHYTIGKDHIVAIKLHVENQKNEVIMKANITCSVWPNATEEKKHPTKPPIPSQKTLKAILQEQETK